MVLCILGRGNRYFTNAAYMAYPLNNMLTFVEEDPVRICLLLRGMGVIGEVMILIRTCILPRSAGAPHKAERLDLHAGC